MALIVANETKELAVNVPLGICSECFASTPNEELLEEDEPMCRYCYEEVLDAVEAVGQDFRDLQTMQIPAEER